LYEHRYKHGKILEPITPEQFEKALAHPYNRTRSHKAFLVLIYLTGARVSEVLRATKESFQLTEKKLYWEVGKRLKHGKQTPPLPLSRDLPHMDVLVEQINRTRKGKRVFDFDRTTAWRHCAKTGLGYNHHTRLTAITFFLKAGYTLAHICNWFGLTVETVNSYVGLVDLEEMGAAKR
jgi:integrase